MVKTKMQDLDKTRSQKVITIPAHIF